MHCVRLNTAVLTHTCIELSRCFTYNASQSSPSASTSPPSPSRLAGEVLRSSSSSSLSPLPPPSSHSPAHPDDQDWPPGWREVSRCPNDLLQRLVAKQCAPSKEDYHDFQSVLLFLMTFFDLSLKSSLIVLVAAAVKETRNRWITEWRCTNSKIEERFNDEIKI